MALLTVSVEPHPVPCDLTHLKVALEPDYYPRRVIYLPCAMHQTIPEHTRLHFLPLR